MEFAEKLQLLRKARGWSQEELAQKINVSRQALSKWESGAAVADTENVIALSRLFGVTTDYLLLEESEAAGAAAMAAPVRENKWPFPRIMWLFAAVVALLGKIALRIWASMLPSTRVYSYMKEEYELLTGIKNLVHLYDVQWLVFLLWVLLIIGIIGTVFYKQLREFFCGGWLKD